MSQPTRVQRGSPDTWPSNIIEKPYGNVQAVKDFREEIREEEKKQKA